MRIQRSPSTGLSCHIEMPPLPHLGVCIAEYTSDNNMYVLIVISRRRCTALTHTNNDTSTVTRLLHCHPCNNTASPAPFTTQVPEPSPDLAPPLSPTHPAPPLSVTESMFWPVCRGHCTAHAPNSQPLNAEGVLSSL